MNPLTNVKNITKLNEIELSRGTVGKKSWHDMYKESAWIFIGGLAYGMTEGDILSVFSQYGEIVNINLIRDTKTGKIKGFCFLCYANQKSTVLAVDNLNGIKLCGRTIRVDHVENYKPPKDHENDDELTKQLKNEGCAPKPIKQENTQTSNDSEVTITLEKRKNKKVKKEKKKHKKKRKLENRVEPPIYMKTTVKEERIDPGYSKNELPVQEKNPKRKDKHRGSLGRQASSTESDSSDSDSKDQPIRKKMSCHKDKVNKPKQNYKEKFDNHSKTRQKISEARGSHSHKTSRKERDELSSDSEDSVEQSRLQTDDGYFNNSSSRSKFYRSSDSVKERNNFDDNHHKERTINSKSSSEYKSSLSKRHRHYTASSSGSDVSDNPKSRVTDKGKEKHTKSKGKRDELEESSSRPHKRYENNPHHRDEADYKRKSRQEKDLY